MKLKVENKVAFWAGLVYFSVMALFFGLRLLSYFGLLRFSGADIVFKIVVQVGLMFVLPVVLFSILTKSKPKKTFAFFNYKKTSGISILYSVLLGICVFVLTIFISSIWSAFLSLFGYKPSGSGSGDYSPLSFVLSLTLTCLLPAICEETTHRGLVLSGMQKNGSIRAIVLCGLLFGFMHFNITQFGYAFVAGMFFALITLLTRSIFPAMIMHFTNNALSTIWSFSQNSDWFHSKIIDAITNFFSSGNPVVVYIVGVLVVLLAMFFVSTLTVKLFEEGKKMQFKKFKQRFLSQLKDEDLQQEPSIKSDADLWLIYRNTQLLKLEEELKKDNINFLDFANMKSRKTFEFVLSKNHTFPEKRKPFDYLFFYLAIALGLVGTIWTFVLGII